MKILHKFGLLAGFLLAVSMAQAQSLTPVSSYGSPIHVIAGSTFTLQITNLAISPIPLPNPSFYETVAFYNNEDPTRLWLTNTAVQLENTAITNYYSYIRIPVMGIQRINGLFDPIRIRVLATFANAGIGIYWFDDCYVTVDDPTFSFNPAAPSVRVGDTVPLVIHRTVAANANLRFEVSSKNGAILGLGTNVYAGIQTNQDLVLMFDKFEVSKTIYISGLSMANGAASTNILLTAQVGSYITNIPVLVAQNTGLVLAPATPQVLAGDTFAMTVSRPSGTYVSPMTVYLNSDNPAFATVPGAVTIPAGAPSASFQVTGIRPGFSVIRATAMGVETNADSVRRIDISAPALSFIPATNQLLIETGTVTTIYIHRPAGQAGADLAVDLMAAPPGVFSLSTNRVVIPAGFASASFSVLGDAAGDALLTAAVGTYSTNMMVSIGEVNTEDPDGDGLNWTWEAYLGGNPYNAHTFDPSLTDGQFDSDGDGINNLNEIYIYGTDPIRIDTDDDGFSDGREVSEFQTHPLHPMSSPGFYERSLNLNAVPAGGFAVPLPSRFAVRTNGWTVETWIRPGADGTGRIFSFGLDGTNTGFWVGLDNYRPRAEIWQGQVLVVGAGGTNLQAQGDIQQLPTNEWSHLAFVWSPNRNSLEVYVNSILLIAQISMAAPDFSQGIATYASSFTDGYLDETRFWKLDRSWDDVSYWHNRYYPAPSGYVVTPPYGNTIELYYRFEDGGSNVVDFAHLNNANYFLLNTAAMVVTNPAVSLLGSDDEDGDQLPEWWVQMHSLDQFTLKTTGPTFRYYDQAIKFLARIEYFKSARLYGSIGANLCASLLGPDQTDNNYYPPVNTLLGFDGRYSSYLKYIYLSKAPETASLKLFTQGMTSTVVYVNGKVVTPTDQTANQYQVLDIASALHQGRNAIYVRCASYYFYYYDEARTERVDKPQQEVIYEGVYGKFDAALTVDGQPLIVRGDTSRNDPRAVWYCQAWSSLEQLGRTEAGLGDPTLPDAENRSVPGNPDYGLPFDADTDNFNAFYEFFCGTNPRDNDSNNNGVPDDLEDFDADGLVNGDEQTRGSHPLLRDTDDDGVQDGADAVGVNDPASALFPTLSRAMAFGGGANDYLAMPLQKRFALTDWTLEAWVRRSATELNGGVILQRIVGPQGLNYELGLGDGTLVPVNVPYVRYISVNGQDVIGMSAIPIGTDWTHLAGTYDSATREMILYVQGVEQVVQSSQSTPALYAGGPVIQRMGRGFDGLVDEVRIWNTVHSQFEVLEDMYSTVPIASDGLIAYYRFDDSTSYTNPPLIGTSYNNWTNVMPWTWGQAQDYVKAFNNDWWEKWSHAASMMGTVAFTTNSALDNKPSLQVNLFPPSAVSSGAQWRVVGVGSWYDSGFTLSDKLDPTNYVVTFNSIAGWTPPADVVVSLTNNQKTIVNATYNRNGSLRVQLSPSAAVQAGAQWRISGGDWLNSNAELTDLSPGVYTVFFAPVSGWAEPASVNLAVQSGLLTTYIASYSNSATFGSLQVNIQPENRWLNGAGWMLNGGSVQTSGAIIGSVPVDAQQVVTFTDVNPSGGGAWVVPAPIPVTLTNATLRILNATYTLADDGQTDTDADGLIGWEEVYSYGTDPNRADSDDDGVNDGAEINQITHPLHPMNSANYFERSLALGMMPAGGVTLADPNRFLFGNSGWTVECWMRPGLDGDGSIFQLGTPGVNSSFRVSLENRRPKVEIFSSTNTAPLIYAGGINALGLGNIQQLPTNEWVHLAFIWSPGRNSLEVYINSVLLIAQESLASPWMASGPAVFGDGFSDGYIDEVRVWDYDRSWDEVSYWHRRLYPAPSGYVESPLYGNSLKLYLRFDDGGANVVDFAHLNDPAYFIPAPAGLVTTNQAISMLGSDDEDGDGLPEWWVQIHNLDMYPNFTVGPRFIMGLIKDCFYAEDLGPVYTNYFDEKADYVARVSYFKAFKAYTSVGASKETGFAWLDPVDNKYYSAKDNGLGLDGRFATFMKYVYLDSQPLAAQLNVFTPGMTSTLVYVNGQLVSAPAEATNNYLSLNVASYLKQGRNMVFIKCVSGYHKYLDAERSQMASPDYKCNHFEGVYGKFDAELVCDDVRIIKRGDQTRNDPRAVWSCQAWSTYEDMNWDPPYPDSEARALPGNQDFGLPLDADTDGMNAYYERLTGTNPRDDDSDNNGIPDGEEDYDGDGLLNKQEQTRGTHPVLPDTDDDSLNDGLDSVGDNDPASSLSPIASRALVLNGGANDAMVFPPDPRFALNSWTMEAWVRRSAADVDGGIVMQRVVGPSGINYELGLGNGVNAPANVPYVLFRSTDGAEVSTAWTGAVPASVWTHLAATYDATRRELMLYVNGEWGSTAVASMKSPALFAGGPIIQNVGAGINGSVDEVRLWSVARTASEILANYLRPMAVNEPNLAAYYRFDDSTSYNAAQQVGTSANNLSSNGVTARPWTWGQVQDYVSAYRTDWQSKWIHAGTLKGNVSFSANGGGALYTPPSLQVQLRPDAVATNGAQWRIANLGDQNWHDTGYTISDGLEEGTYMLTFKDVYGWTAPIDLAVDLTNNTKTVVTVNYTRNGALEVNLYPAGAVAAGAKWRVDGGAWNNSGVKLENLMPGTHSIEFMDVPGWATPAADTLTIYSGQTTTYIASYVERPSGIYAIIQPQEAVDAGATWRLAGGGTTWQMPNTLQRLTTGTYRVEFSTINGWIKPGEVTAYVTNGMSTTITGVYYEINVIDTLGTNILGALNRPRGLAFDSRRRLYVADQMNNRLVVWDILSNTWTTIGSYGTGLGQFYQPTDVFIDRYDNLYVAEAGNHRVQRRDGVTLAWTNWGGTGNWLFDRPLGVMAMDDGTIYVADTGHNRILKRNTNSNWTVFLQTDGTNVNCGVQAPQDLVMGDDGFIYLADMPNGLARIRRISLDGLCYDVVGSSATNYGQFGGVSAICFDELTGRMLAVDQIKNAAQTRNMSLDTWSPLVSLECALNQPQGIGADGIGNIYIADTGNNRVIRLNAYRSYIASPAVASLPYSAGGTNGFIISWQGQERVFYDVLYSENLLLSYWTTICSQLKGSNDIMRCVDPTYGGTSRFYRVNAF